jgi:hypothetical protein
MKQVQNNKIGRGYPEDDTDACKKESMMHGDSCTIRCPNGRILSTEFSGNKNGKSGAKVTCSNGTLDLLQGDDDVKCIPDNAYQCPSTNGQICDSHSWCNHVSGLCQKNLIGV